MCDLLGRSGLATLDNPQGMVQQLGFLVRDHEHFRALLARCYPEYRWAMYESLRPHLRFEAKPLDVYISEAAQEAERRQLPMVDADGQLHPYTPPQAGDQQKRDIEIAQAATDAARARKHLILSCRKCTREETFSGLTKTDCWGQARQAGWQLISDGQGGYEVCPECPKSGAWSLAGKLKN